MASDGEVHLFFMNEARSGMVTAGEGERIKPRDWRDQHLDIWHIGTFTFMGQFDCTVVYSDDKGETFRLSPAPLKVEVPDISSDSPAGLARTDDGRIVRIGYREVLKDPRREDPPPPRGDFGTAYPFPMTANGNQVLIASRQGAGIVLADHYSPPWDKVDRLNSLYNIPIDAGLRLLGSVPLAPNRWYTVTVNWRGPARQAKGSCSTADGSPRCR